MWAIHQTIFCFNQKRTFTCMRIYDWNTSHGKNMKLSGVYYVAEQHLWLCQPTSEGGLAPFIPYNTSNSYRVWSTLDGSLCTSVVNWHWELGKCSPCAINANTADSSAPQQIKSHYQIVNVSLRSTEKDDKINAKKHLSMELCYQSESKHKHTAQPA